MLSNKTVLNTAKEYGFDLVGFAKAEILEKEIQNLSKWLEFGYQAGMNYMERNLDKKMDVRKILPGAKSVISLGVNYQSDENHSKLEGHGKISRYAWGKDYHLIIWDKLEKFEKRLRELDSGFESKSYVDTGPVMDKVWAVRSGIGWLGKHTNVINREYGSWFFIANIICNRQFDYPDPVSDMCGTCTACIDACPTDAITNEYVVNSNKCISFLTIENKRGISDEFLGKFDDWIFGCDICQDVCPWNHKFSQPAKEKEFQARETALNLGEVLEMTNSQFRIKFGDSPISRARLKGLKRNAEFLIDSKK